MGGGSAWLGGAVHGEGGGQCMGNLFHRSDECGETTFVGRKEVTELVLSCAVDYIYQQICNHVAIFQIFALVLIT